MQISQILVRPSENLVLVQFVDSAGRLGSVSYSTASNATANALIAEAQQRVPSEQNHPAKTEIEQEIEELEYRLTQLKESIGQQ